MEIRITGRKFAVSDDLHEFIEERANKFLRFWDRLNGIKVTLDKEGPSHRVEVQVSVKNREFVSRGADGKLMVAVDQAMERLERQLTKHKDKLMTRRKDHRDRAEPPEAGEETTDESDTSTGEQA